MIRQSNRGTTIAVLILGAIVCLGPLPFGSVLARDRLMMDLLACLALVVVLSSPGPEPVARPGRRAAVALALVGVLGLLQSLPWPRGVVEVLAPSVLDHWDRSSTLLGKDAESVPLSLAPTVSRSVALHWLAVVAAFGAAQLVGRERYARRTLGGALVLVAILEMVYGGGLMATRSSAIWGVEVPGDPARLRGTYVNSDHLATLLLMAFTVACGALWWGLRRSLRRSEAEVRVLTVLPPAVAAVVLFAGLAFTGSRAGLLAATFAMLAMGALLTFHYRRWQVALSALLVVTVAILGVSLFGWRQGFGRLLGTSAYEVTWNARIEAYAATIDLWQLSPWVGTGLGTFRQTFPLVQPADVAGTWEHAHSDVLELLATTGVLGLPLLAAALWWVSRQLWSVFRRGRRSEDRAAGFAVLGVLIGVGLHALVDFGLTIPANNLILAIVVGAACGVPLRRPE